MFDCPAIFSSLVLNVFLITQCHRVIVEKVPQNSKLLINHDLRMVVYINAHFVKTIVLHFTEKEASRFCVKKTFTKYDKYAVCRSILWVFQPYLSFALGIA